MARPIRGVQVARSSPRLVNAAPQESSSATISTGASTRSAGLIGAIGMRVLRRRKRGETSGQRRGDHRRGDAGQDRQPEDDPIRAEPLAPEDRPRRDRRGHQHVQAATDALLAQRSRRLDAQDHQSEHRLQDDRRGS